MPPTDVCVHGWITPDRDGLRCPKCGARDYVFELFNAAAHVKSAAEEFEAALKSDEGAIRRALIRCAGAARSADLLKMRWDDAVKALEKTT